MSGETLCPSARCSGGHSVLRHRSPFSQEYGDPFVKMGTPCTAYKLYLMITIPSTEIVCLRLSESYVATQSDIAAYWYSNYLKDCNGVQLSLFRTVVLQPGFVIKDIANSFFPLSQDRFYIDRPQFGYGTLARKLFSGGSRGSPIYRKNGDLGAPFSQGSPQNFMTLATKIILWSGMTRCARPIFFQKQVF